MHGMSGREPRSSTTIHRSRTLLSTGLSTLGIITPVSFRMNEMAGRLPMSRDRICYHGGMDVVALQRETRAADEAAKLARARLVSALRSAHASGMSQREIAAHSGRSQAEVNRLLRFHGSSPRARRLRERRKGLAELLASAGLTNVRVFGSVANGNDHDGSDIDLLVTATEPMGLLALSRVELEASKLLGLPVDLLLDHSIRPDLRDRILAEAVAL